MNNEVTGSIERGLLVFLGLLKRIVKAKRITLPTKSLVCASLKMKRAR